jgi:branched-subunit amino acid transport protein
MTQRARRWWPMNNFILYLAVMAGTTYLLRLLPMLIFRHRIKNRFIRSFLYYIPYAVLTVMAIPAIFHSTTYIASGIIAAAVAIALAYLRRSLIVVAIGAASAVAIAELIIPMLL